MNITNLQMAAKMARVLRDAGDLHEFADIEAGLQSGDMQGHVEGDTWAITQVQDYPRRKVVYILYLVGRQEDVHALEDKITEWAKEIGASRIMAVGREGWWKFRTAGWKQVGIQYAKEL